MAITHHPDVATLMSCAAGSLPEALAAVIASHLAMCPQCAAEVSRMERIGATLFDAIKPEPVSGEAPVFKARALEAEGVATEEPAAWQGDVPRPLAGVLGSRLDELPWKWLAPGVSYVRIPLSPGAKGDLRLLKVAPGCAVPEHGHGGSELTVLLTGSYTDEFGTFRQGDVADLDVDAEHRPVADLNEGCVCLVASDRKARFKSLLARLIQPFVGM